MPGKLWPVRESVFSRYKKLSSGQRALGNLCSRCPELVPAPLDIFRFILSVSHCRAMGRAVCPRKPFNPTSGPVADRQGIARSTRILQIPGELLVLFRVGTGR